MEEKCTGASLKNKGGVQSCSNHRGIKLMSHKMKILERAEEARLTQEFTVCVSSSMVS